MPDLLTGVCTPIVPGVHRVLAPNPGFMTGAGTNTYLIGHRELTVLDPGPASEAHVAAIISAAGEIGGRITRIVLTHTHKDHSPAAAALVERTGARVIGLAPVPGDPAQDTSVRIDHQPAHEERISGEDRHLIALHTPGHVGNHVCYWLEEAQLLFTGDHLINGSTVVIIPPSGNMSDYIHSLELLQPYPIRQIAPGHGDIIEQGHALIEYTIRHRLARESKVLVCLTAAGEADLAGLVGPVYDDVNPALHALAQYSLLAHLLKLEREGKVQRHGERWQPC